MSEMIRGSEPGEILRTMIGLLEKMTEDWDNDFDAAMNAETRLVSDLCFESIDIVQLIVAIEGAVGRRDLPFEKLLMEDGRYVDEVTIGEIVEFLHVHLQAPAA